MVGFRDAPGGGRTLFTSSPCPFSTMVDLGGAPGGRHTRVLVSTNCCRKQLMWCSFTELDNHLWPLEVYKMIVKAT